MSRQASSRGIFVLFLCLTTQMAAGAESGRPFALDPAMSPSEYVFQRWGIDEGLPQATVVGLAQTPDGYLWVATEVGLARFDGVSFRVFDHLNTPGLDSQLCGLTVSDDGALWIGSFAGAMRMKDGRIRKYSRDDGLPSNTVPMILQRRDGSIWMATGGGIAVLAGGKITRYTSEDGLPHDSVHSLAEDASGVVWAGTARGLARLRGSRFEAVRHPLLPSHPISALAADGNALWIGSKGGGIARYENGAVQRFTTKEGLGGDYVFSLVRSSNGALWIGSGGAPMTRYHNGRFVQFGTAEQTTWAVFEDHNGSLWFSTPNGLGRFKAPKILTRSVEHGLSGAIALTVRQDRTGAVWVGTAGAFLNRFRDGRFEKFGSSEGVPGPVIFSIAERRDGSIWIGTNGGIARFDGNAFRPPPGAERYPKAAALCMYEDADGSLWIGTKGEGAFHVSGERFETFTVRNGLPSNQVYDIRRDRDGVLWFATNDGLGRFEKGEFTSLRMGDGLRSNATPSFEEDQRGNLWVATWGGGITRIRGRQVRSFTSHDGLFDDNVHRVIADGAGNLWLSTNRGIDSVSLDAIDAFERGQIRRLPVRHYAQSDGMRHRECNGGVNPAGWRLEDGSIWIPTMEGVAVVDPRRLRADPPPPAAIVEGVFRDGRPVDLGAPIAFRSGQSRLDFRYTAPDLYAAEGLTFEYMLEGFDPAWIAAGTSRRAEYTNIPHGRYRFRVRVTNREGRRNESGVPIAMEVLPRFHQTRAFYGLVIVGILIVIGGGHRLRTRAFRRRQTELLELVAERTRAENAIRRSEQHFRSLIENASDMILVLDPAGMLVYASPSLKRETGYAPDWITGRALAEFVHPNDTAQFQSLLAAKTGAPAAVAFRMRHADGSFRFIDAVGRRIHEDAAETIVVNCRDVTDRRRLESRLEQADRLSSLGRLAATVAHEFNNVLMGISPFVEILRARSADDPRMAEATGHILRSIGRGKRITDEILRYTRPVEVSLRKVRVASWMEELRREIAGLAGPSIELRLRVEDPSLCAAIDPPQLTQVIANLALNARDAMPSGGTLTVSAEACSAEAAAKASIERPGDFVHLSVSDTGAGIRPDVIDRIFDPLFTTKPSGGTGLGLTIAHQIVMRHGGIISAESVPYGGTSFHIFVPRAAEADAEAIAEVPAPAKFAGKVLVVEDDPAVAAGIDAILKAEGAETTIVHRGADAILSIAQELPDAVVLDLSLPDMDGLVVYGTIAERWPTLPVVFSTGHGDARRLEPLTTNRHVGFLMKPYDGQTLIDELRVRTSA